MGKAIPLSKFVRESWHAIEPSTRYYHGWHIDAICEHLEAVSTGQIRNLIINMPPRHMKSITVSVNWPAWVWTWRPQHRWMFSSYGKGLAVRDCIKMRHLIDSEWYQARWSDKFLLTVAQKTYLETDWLGYRISTSVGGAATGEGGHTIVVDDPHKVQEAESETKRESVLDWWDQTMGTRLNDPQTGSKVIIMQRVHEADLVGHIVEKMQQGGESYEMLVLPAEYEGKKYETVVGWSDPRTEYGELLWPERIPAKEIKKLQVSLGSRAYAGQFQQRPAPAEGQIFKRTWWKFWRPAAADLPPVRLLFPDGTSYEAPVVPLPANFLEMLQSWDMAFTDTTGSAFNVGQVWGRLGARKFLLDQVRGRWDMPQTTDEVRKLRKRWPKSKLILIENKANGPAIIQTLRGSISGIVPVNPMGDKVARAHAVTPTVESGNVYLPHPHIAPWIYEYIEELAMFPNSQFKDQVDTTTQALVRLIRNENRSKSASTTTSVSMRTL